MLKMSISLFWYYFVRDGNKLNKLYCKIEEYCLFNITCASLLLCLFLVIWIRCNTIYDMVHVFRVFISKIRCICIFSVIAYGLSKCIIFAWKFHIKWSVLYAQREKLESSFFALGTMRSRVILIEKRWIHANNK